MDNPKIHCALSCPLQVVIFYSKQVKTGGSELDFPVPFEFDLFHQQMDMIHLPIQYFNLAAQSTAVDLNAIEHRLCY